MRYDEQEALEFAYRIKAMGFKVFLAEKKTYGYITDDTGLRVLSFSAGMFGRLSGNYGPSSTASGTGWVMDITIHDLRTKKDVIRALYCGPQFHTGDGWRYFLTEKQYRDDYQSSSKFREI